MLSALGALNEGRLATSRPGTKGGSRHGRRPVSRPASRKPVTPLSGRPQPAVDTSDEKNVFAMMAAGASKEAAGAAEVAPPAGRGEGALAAYSDFGEDYGEFKAAAGAAVPAE
jgi:hypothetical protein